MLDDDMNETPSPWRLCVAPMIDGYERGLQLGLVQLGAPSVGAKIGQEWVRRDAR